MYVNKEKAKSILNSGGVVAIPTETVYGLAARIDDESALKKVFSVKERPFFDPLIVHASSIEMARSFVKEWPVSVQKIAKEFWPGPLTLILKKDKKISDLITSGLDSVGVRIPQHEITLELIREVGTGLAAPSANKFKKTSPTKAIDVEEEFSGSVAVMEGGSTNFGIESTIVAVYSDHLEIYRPGPITASELTSVSGLPAVYKKSPVAPGQLKHHYMPKIPITITFKEDYIDIIKLEDKEMFLKENFIWNIDDNPALVARKLYSSFRLAEKESFKKIFLILKKDYLIRDEWQGVINRIMKAKTNEV